ncbi:MAG: tetratricopeptide repeat protein [Muribaculaceae bacterium]|nr:tetratricopeptide repeat protein [Muribaculaceae bacterium]
MKIKVFLSFLAGCALAVSAQSQGYKDGIEYYKAGQYDNAKTILTNTLNQAGTDKALANYYLGQTCLSLGDKAAAKQYFDAGIAADAANPYNYVGVGALDLLNGNKSAAEDNFKEAQKLGKKNHEITVAIARAYYNADPVAYAKEIDKYLAKAHKDSKHEEPSIYILEGDMLFDQGDFGGAAAKYEMAIRYDNANPEGYVKYANSYFRVNPQFSIAKLEEFLQVAPGSALAQRELAEKYYEANFWNKAAEQYGRYIQNPNHFPEDKARYAVLLYYGEKYPQSLKVANEVLAEHPGNFLMQRLRFLNEVQVGDNENGVKHASQFFNDNPNGYFTYNDYTTYADALTNLGQDSLALVQYEIAAEKFPENANVLSGLTNMYHKNKNYLKAAETYDKYLSTQEKADLNDLMLASGRWLNVAATAGEDQALRARAAQAGLAHIDNVLAGAQPNPYILQRKARLQLAGNGSVPNAESIQTYKDMIALLDQDPANADPANADNALQLYKEACLFAISYYTKVDENPEEALYYSNMLKEINEKLGQ